MFGKKKKDEDGAVAETAASAPAPSTALVPDPARARKFFEHARTVHETTNYEYAMQSWLRGLRFDPTDLGGLEGFFSSTAMFLGSGKGKLSKETAKIFDGKGDVEKFLLALLAWGTKPTDPAAAVRAAELAAKMDLGEQVYWISERAIPLALGDKKPRKDLLLKLVDANEKVGAYDLAVRAGEGAMRLDPADSELQNRMRNMSAQATMTRGGFDDVGQEGGFRKNIRDSAKQRQLEEEERIVKTDDVKDRVVLAAEAAFKERPEDLPTITKLIRALRERGKPEDEQRAVRVAMDAYQRTRQFRFRQEAGEIKLRVARRKLEEYRERAAQNPNDAAAQEALAKAEQKFLEMELVELNARVANYPTDLGLKYELGRRQFQVGDYEAAIALFQESKGDSKHRSSSLKFLGQSFEKIGWHDEAIATFRQALEVHQDENNELGMELRYGLMSALANKADRERDMASAEEADKLASAIAIQQIGYRDIKAQRDRIKKTIGELRA